MFIPFLLSGSSILLGYLLGHYTQEELTPGKRALHLLCFFSLLLISGIPILLFPIHVVPLFAGAITGFFLPLPLLYLGFLLNSTLLPKNIFFLLSSLTFVYGLARGSLLYLTNNLFPAFLTFAIFIISFAFPHTSITLISFLIGALLSCSIKELTHVIPHWHRPQRRTGSHLTRSHRTP